MANDISAKKPDDSEEKAPSVAIETGKEVKPWVADQQANLAKPLVTPPMSVFQKLNDEPTKRESRSKSPDRNKVHTFSIAKGIESNEGNAAVGGKDVEEGNVPPKDNASQDVETKRVSSSNPKEITSSQASAASKEKSRAEEKKNLNRTVTKEKNPTPGAETSGNASNKSDGGKSAVVGERGRSPSPQLSAKEIQELYAEAAASVTSGSRGDGDTIKSFEWEEVGKKHISEKGKKAEKDRKMKNLRKPTAPLNNQAVREEAAELLARIETSSAGGGSRYKGIRSEDTVSQKTTKKDNDTIPSWVGPPDNFCFKWVVPILLILLLSVTAGG